MAVQAEDELARDRVPKMSRELAQTRARLQAPLVAKPRSGRRNALVVVAVVAIAGLAATNTKPSPISAVASTSTCDTPTAGQTCGDVFGKPGDHSGFVAGHAFTPCYCSPTQGTKEIKVRVVGCLGKCDAGKQCPHVLHDYFEDYGTPKKYPYPHLSILSDAVEVDIAEFKKVISAAAHKGGSTNWWKPDFTHTKFHPSTPSIELRDRSDSGPSTTLKDLCDAIKKYTPPTNSGLPKITACDGMETSAGTHITVPHAWVSNGGLGQSHEDYLHGDTSGLTWWVTFLYSEDNCFEAYPYHLASA